jgi:cytochrome P450
MIGEIWKFHRSMTRPYFTRDRISHFENFARHSDLAISKILERLAEPARPGTPSAVDFQDVVARFTIDSGTEFLFGGDVKSLEAPLPYPFAPPSDESGSFAAAFGRAQEGVVMRLGLAHLWPWMELFWDRTHDDMEIIDAFVKPILKQKLEQKRALGRNAKSSLAKDDQKDMEEGENDSMLDHLVRFTDGEHMFDICCATVLMKVEPDETIIKDEVVNILVAARDTVCCCVFSPTQAN